jgi:hypothetical protein
MSEKYTPEPWNGNTHQGLGAKGKILPKADYHRATDCVNACAGQRIDLVELATAHYDSCVLWETEMMKAIGEDGVGPVSEAIAKLKAQRDEAVKALESAPVYHYLPEVPKDGEWVIGYFDYMNQGIAYLHSGDSFWNRVGYSPYPYAWTRIPPKPPVKKGGSDGNS